MMGKIIDSSNCTHFYYNGCNVWPCEVLDSKSCVKGYVMVKTHFWVDPRPVAVNNVIPCDSKRLSVKYTKKTGWKVSIK